MSKKSVLFIDDNPRCLPTEAEQEDLQSEFGLEAVLANPNDPVASALSLVVDPSIVGVLTDKCNQLNFQHIQAFRSLRPDVAIGLLSGQLTESDKARAIKAGADACFKKGESITDFYSYVSNDFHAAGRRFREELPSLLKDPKLIGRWVAYTREGQIGVADDDLSLISECETRLKPDEFVIGQIVPDPGELEVSESWFPMDQP
jgi:hypothetical protein